MKKRQRPVGLLLGLIAGIALFLFWRWPVFSFRAGVDPSVSGGRIHVPQPKELGTLLPSEPAGGGHSSPAAAPQVQKKSVRARGTESIPRLMEKGLAPPPEEAQRMEKKGVMTY